MRRIVGVFAVLSFATVVVNAQPPRERAVTFKPPQPLQPGEPGLVARGAADEFPPSSFLPSTPVKRTSEPARAPVAGNSPLWLNGVDPNVIPAAGTAGKTNGVRPLSPTPTGNPPPKDEPAFSGKNIDKIKNAIAGNDKPKTPGIFPQQQQQQQQQPEQPTAVTPFRGTSASGAPVFAGPPAYRWYGWGSVTPGANAFAPNGVYPKASANWYSITGATPGAFPVPVMNPLRSPPGTEPPTYGVARVTPQPVVPVSTQPAVSPWPQPPAQPSPQLPPQPRPTLPTAEPSKFGSSGESKFLPTPSMSTPPVTQPMPVSLPKMTPPPATTPMPVSLPPVPVTVKEAAPIPIPSLTPAPKPDALATTDTPKPLPFVPSVVPLVPSVEPNSPDVKTPTPLPVSVVEDTKQPQLPEVKREEPKPAAPKREEYHWQTAPEPTQPAPGTWTPAGGQQPQPKPLETVPAWKAGDANAKPIVVRAQMPNNDKDPVATLIRQVCNGRASDLEVRWAGTKKLYVCFEIRTADEARKLVTDISKRPELAPYQIDFCVVVK